jgi:fibronectin-binding autotransporter adhesin
MDGFYGNYASSIIVEAGGSIAEASLLSIGTADTPVSTMLVQSGGTVTVTDAFIGGPFSVSHGAATVTGAYSTWTINNNLDLGGNTSNPIGGTGEILVSNGGWVQSTNTKLWNGSSSITVDGSTFSTGSLSGAGSVHINNNGAPGSNDVGIGASSGTSTFTGNITGNGNVTKVGGSTQILAGSNSYTGFTMVYGGTLRLNSGTSSQYRSDNGSTLILGFGNLGSSTVLANFGGTIKYDSPAISGGFLEGNLGTHDIQNVASFNGTTIGLNVHFNPAGPMQLNNVTNNGLISNSAGNILNWSHGVNGQFARLDIGYATTNVSDFLNNGQIRIFAGTLNNSVTPLVTSAGSGIDITSDVGGSTLNLGGQTLEVNGGLVVNDGTINGTTNINSGGLVKGTGVFGPINVLAGGKASPGNSPGSMTSGNTIWDSGGTYLFEMDDAWGSGGENWDLWNVNGQLSMTARVANRFVIAINSLNGGAAGKAAGFIKEENYSWLIARADGGINGFDPVRFTIDSSQFANNTAGSFSISQSGNDVFLNYAASVAPPQWNLDANGSWAVAANWLPVGVPNGATALANFLGKITAPRTVTLDGNRTVSAITFDNANAYTIAGGTGGMLTVGDGTTGTINVTSGAHKISALLAFSGSVTKTGPGTLTIDGVQKHDVGSGLTVRHGQLNLNSNAGSAATPATAASARLGLTLGNTGWIELGADQDLHELTINFSDPGTQRLNLGSHSVRVYSSDLALAKTTLYAALRNTHGPGSFDPWDGIYDNGPYPHLFYYPVGLARVTDVHGQEMILIRATVVGDSNLDGNVSIADFIDLASHFGETGVTWQEGDMNYDGQVTISDFIDLAAHFNTSFSGEAWPISAEEQRLLADFAASIGADSVPEPSAAWFALLAGALTMKRGRRS